MSEGSGGSKVLFRPRAGRMVGGVCAGLANYTGMDVTLMRVIWAVVAIITGGAGLLAYLVSWIIIPDESKVPPVVRPADQRQDTWTRLLVGNRVGRDPGLTATGPAARPRQPAHP
jgi:phage shock protein C